MQIDNVQHFDLDKFRCGLQRRGYNLIGEGAYSRVYAKPGSNRVVKVNRSDDNWLDYVLWGMAAGYAGTLTPRVYSFRTIEYPWGVNYVAIVERMTATLRQIDHTPLFRHYCAIGKAARGYTVDLTEAERAVPGCTQFAADLCSRFAGSLDLHGSNAMVRPDGTLCFTDPVNGYSSRTAPRRMRARDLTPQIAA
jgi:hypothetical protein